MNLWLYNKYREVPKNAQKAFKAGSFSGTDINTMWRIKTLTEEFGVCGFGWYTELIRQWSEQGANDELMCFVEIKLYIKIDNEWSKGFSAIGGSKIIQYFSNKKYLASNDEGYKMAYTDALGVACKYLGFGADVYWENDKTKYTKAEDTEPLMTQTQLNAFKDLEIDPRKVAIYYKTTVEKLTEKQAQDAINKKQKWLKEKQKAADNG